MLAFVGAVFGLCGVVSVLYPDKASTPREFEGGLEKELGGPNAVRVSLSMVIFMLRGLTFAGKNCWRSFVREAKLYIERSVRLQTIKISDYNDASFILE